MERWPGIRYWSSGNVKSIGTQSFRYDGVSRLVEARIWVPETTPPLYSFDDGFEVGSACNWEVRNPDPGCYEGPQQLGIETYEYDRFGNLTSRTTTTSAGAAVVQTPAVTSTNRLASGVYDVRGNLTGYGGAGYTFDVLNRMTRMVSGSEDWLFGYGANGERVVQIAEGGAGERRYTLRDAGARVIREWAQADGASPIVWTRDWIHRGSQVLATVVPGAAGAGAASFVEQAEGETSSTIESAAVAPEDTTLHLTLDHLGTPRLVTNAIGERKAFHTYWPYGREATDALQNELRLKFTGHERDRYDATSTADDLDYMHARFNSPMIGRLLSVDPASGVTGEPQSWNRYAYARGNPIRLIDRTGTTVESALNLVVELKPAIEAASILTGGAVSPLEIARVLFQENMNDGNLVRGEDGTDIGFGGAELKNMLAALAANFSGQEGRTLGVGEMSVSVAAKLMGLDPQSLTQDQRTEIIAALQDPAKAVFLVALHLWQLKTEHPSASFTAILTAYYAGRTTGAASEVALRSGSYVRTLDELLSSDAANGHRVVRCNGGYHFEHQCE